MTALPDSIIQNGLFCCWKYEERNGRKTKVPYQPETGLGAKSNDPSSFVPYKTAVQASGYDGIGIGIFNGICAIDLDNCVSDSGYYTQTAAEIVALMHSYTEYSPSGNGLHILFSAKGFQYDTKRFYIMDYGEFEKHLKSLLGKVEGMSASRLTGIAMVLAVMDKTAVVQKDRKGEIIKDTTTKDTEIIKLTQDPEKYFEAEVYTEHILPSSPDESEIDQ